MLLLGNIVRLHSQQSDNLTKLKQQHGCDTAETLFNGSRINYFTFLYNIARYHSLFIQQSQSSLENSGTMFPLYILEMNQKL